jgi:hypothetical protein
VPSAVFWYSQLPQTVQFQLLLIFVMWLGGPIALTPEAARSPCGGTLDGLPTNSRQALQGCIAVSDNLIRRVKSLGLCRVLLAPLDRPALRGCGANSAINESVRVSI